MYKMGTGNLTRKNIAATINEHIGFSRQLSGALVDFFFDKLKAALLAKEDVTIFQFGRFKIRQKISRIGRNPKSRESVEILKRSMVSFKPSKLLREKINKGI